MKDKIIYKSIVSATIIISIMMLLIYNYDKGNFQEYSFLAELCFGIVPGLIFGITFASTFENKSISNKLIYLICSTLIYSLIALLGVYFLKYFYLFLALSSFFGGNIIFLIYFKLSRNKLQLKKGIMYLSLISIILPLCTVIYEHSRIPYFYDLSIRAFMPILLTIFIWQILFGAILKACLNNAKN